MALWITWGPTPKVMVFCRGFFIGHPCCLVKGRYPKQVIRIAHRNRSYTNKQHGGLINIVRKESQRTKAHIQHIFWGDYLVPFFFRKVSSIPITSCHILYSFFPWFSDSSQLLHQQKLWQEMDFKIQELLRCLTLFPSLPGLCGIVASTWVADHDGFCSFKVVNVVFFVYQVACICCPGWFQLLSGSSQSGASAARSSRPHIVVALERWNLPCHDAMFVDMMTKP